MLKTTLERICEKITKHKFRRLIGSSEVAKEYYYECKICKMPFWNNKKPKKEV